MVPAVLFPVRRRTDLVRLALIGCGIWGEKILQSLLDLEQEIVVVEPSPDRRVEITERFQVECLEHIEGLPKVDGIIVSTPASTHVEVVQQLLPLQLPVFIEKPLTTDLAGAHALASASGAQLSVMHVWHYHPGVCELRRIARDRILGPVTQLRTTRKNWTSPRTDVDSVWTLVPHDLSIAQSILGHIPKPRFACVERLNNRATGMLAVLGDDRLQVVIDTSNRYRDKRREIRLHGQSGVAVLEADGDDRIFIDREKPGSTGVSTNGEYIRFSPEAALTTELLAFVRFLEGGPPPPTTVQQGVEVVEAIVALRRLAGLED